jgi:hypothetical protein
MTSSAIFNSEKRCKCQVFDCSLLRTCVVSFVSWEMSMCRLLFVLRVCFTPERPIFQLFPADPSCLLFPFDNSDPYPFAVLAKEFNWFEWASGSDKLC